MTFSAPCGYDEGSATHQSNGFWLVVLNTEFTYRNTQIFLYQKYTLDNVHRGLHHLAEIACYVRFAFGGVDNEGVHGSFHRVEVQLYVSGKACSSQTGKTALTHRGNKRLLVGDFGRFNVGTDGLQTVRFDNGSLAHSSACKQEIYNVRNRTGNRRVDRRGHKRVRIADLLTHRNRVSLFHKAFAWRSHVLGHRYDHAFRQREIYRLAVFRTLVMAQVYAVELVHQ